MFNTKGNNLLETLSLQALLVTQGESGMTLFQHNTAPVKLNAESHEVFDVTGAGDTVIATLAAALASGHSLVDATAMANIAAGIVVEKLGAATVTTSELNNKLRNKGNKSSVIVDEPSLQTLLAEIRANEKKIVMTNGCFDILHAGHVEYLKQAKALGDFLIVAVNDDASVQRLKGENRPVNNLNDRMTVLAGLESVDYLVVFAEDTPARLIAEIKPDILVKGGDYQPDEIAGAEAVKNNGGEVRIIPLIDGCSTSNIIDRLR